jgi:NAD(P)-dependent dehydrogenase (short-subunit alcohol dehydrogenase family)
VGSATVAQFAAAGWNVVATAHRTIVDSPPGVTIRKTDLTDRADASARCPRCHQM